MTTIMHTWPPKWLEAAYKAGFAVPMGEEWQFRSDKEREALAVFAQDIYEAAYADGAWDAEGNE